MHPYLEEHLTTEGHLEVLHEDDPSGGRYRYFLRRPEGRLALHFAAEAPTLQTDDHVRVSGVRVRQTMALSSGTSNVTTLALAQPATFGPQRTAVILVTYQDTPTPSWMSSDRVRNIILSDDPASVSNFFREASYGQTWLTGDVYGPYVMPMNQQGCPRGSIATYADQATRAQVGTTAMAAFHHFVYVFPSSSCGWRGTATVGGSPSQAWINGDVSTSVVGHEMGHNLGLMHSNKLVCDGVSVGPNCTPVEYGDLFDMMGSVTTMHFNAIQKQNLGWLDYPGMPPITTVQTSGVYTIDPYETMGTNPKALRVKTPRSGVPV